MANASRKHMGPNTRGKGAGVGATSEIAPEALPEHGVLSNRDKAAHTEERGLDSKGVQTDEWRTHAANRMPRSDDPGEKGEND
ncbi:hypothetical protein [Aquabacter spiritensis]|uniref:Uncharacterized protein n=1 Tax=Aquabacter spiritensis TaxID=933073 RepID=A0A4R3M4Z4_9HYPH|nr:hypothetical protein [Aquabacter spiritensis]TCT07653.1 hypothetical protein EDC64_101172 [Aquabacter spiritensis]